jgi:hypothetical protein
MMKTTLILLMGVSLITMAADSAEAAGRHDRRQNAQGARTRQGVRSGELTRGENRAIQAQQAKVRRIERRAEADGTVTPEEKARLEKAQDRASRQIHRLKNNGNDRNKTGGEPTDTAPTQE